MKFIPLGNSWILTLAVAARMTSPALHSAEPAEAPAVLETSHYRFEVDAGSGHYRILDKNAQVTWQSHPNQSRLGEATLHVEGESRTLPLNRCEIGRSAGGLDLVFRPWPGRPNAFLEVEVKRGNDERTLEMAYRAAPDLRVDSVRLLDHGLWIGPGQAGYAVVPVREGLLIPADQERTFTHRFDTYAYEGCHMAMLGLVKEGASALLTWDDPYVAAEVTRGGAGAIAPDGSPVLAPSLTLRQTARSFRIHLLGRGDYNHLAEAYREVAREKGWLVTWDEKLRGHPERARLFGAINYKLWSVLDRRMNETSTEEERVRVNWTFDEAAQVAEHLKNDLQLDHVLFLMGGWIRRGYDNQHPDILPAAPECGGDQALTDCARRVRQLGYLFGLHDNYQDMYRDAPSWDESYLMRRPDGSLARGGHWAGGIAYLTCSQRAVELAQRPQNLPAVLQLTRADAYFIDTTYAAGLQECFSPDHPLTRADDMHWKQVISDEARQRFGLFGSECGREWAIPHSDFFEGLTGVSGRAYHNAELLGSAGGVVVPLFELVYRDAIVMYGKYGYDPATAADYVLHHITLGRPLHYHNIPAHLYWKGPIDSPESTKALGLRPAVAKLNVLGPSQVEITYRWTVTRAPDANWRVFVHFTDDTGGIMFQNDHAPEVPTSQWQPGEVEVGPFKVTLPDGATGEYEIRMGLFQSTAGGRAPLEGVDDGERRYRVGMLTVGRDRIEWEAGAGRDAAGQADPGIYTRGEGGWTAGLHPMDRFVKNTYEILSPFNEMTSRMRMTRHEFLTADRQVQRSVFGQGKNAVTAVVNHGQAEYEGWDRNGQPVRLPQYGFTIESEQFAAFLALSWGGIRYDQPVLFTLRSLDDRPWATSGRVRIYHGFGENRIAVGEGVHQVDREAVVSVRR